MKKSSKPVASTVFFGILQIVLFGALVLVLGVQARSTVRSGFRGIQTPQIRELNRAVIHALENESAIELLPRMTERMQSGALSLARIDGFLEESPIQLIRLVYYDTTGIRRLGGEFKRRDRAEFISIHQDFSVHWTLNYVTEEGRAAINHLSTHPWEMSIDELNQYYDQARLGWRRALSIVLATAIIFSLMLTLWHYYHRSPYPRVIPMLMLMVCLFRIVFVWNELTFSFDFFSVSWLPIRVFHLGSAFSELRIFLPVFVAAYWLFWRKRLLAKDQRKLVAKHGSQKAVEQTSE